MAGKFELIINPHGDFRFRLLDNAGDVLAISGPYIDKNSAVAGIVSARENAAMALITDRTAIPRQRTTPIP